MTVIRRSIQTAIELRATADGKPSKIVGYGARFFDPADPGTEYRVDEMKYRERIAPCAFDRALRDIHDVRGLYDHDTRNLLGRVGAGTLKLSVDNRGLWYEIDMGDDPTVLAQDVARMLRRGDLYGSSFAFRAKHSDWSDEPDGWLLRTVTDVDLFDVGPVTFPAYDSASSEARAVLGGIEDLAALVAERRSQTPAKQTLSKDHATMRARAIGL